MLLNNTNTGTRCAESDCTPSTPAIPGTRRTIVGRRARLVEGLGMHVGKGLGHRRLERSKHGLHRVSTAPRDVSADSDVDFRGRSGAALEQDILGAFQRGVELRGGGVDRDVLGLTHVDEPADRLHVAVA
eukprot:2253541-Rhodomonas_salina.1